MKKINFKDILPHIVAIVVFFSITYAYFPSILEGKKIKSQDMLQYAGSSKEIKDYHERTGKHTLWTNSMFGGMPAYLISMSYPANLFFYFGDINMKMNKPANYLFLSLLSFYILLLAFKVNPWLSIAGAIGYAFTTYFFVVESVGHHTKALAMSYLPGVIAGVYLAYRKKIWFGTMLFAIFFALQLTANHFQITYYTFLIILIFGIYQLISDLKEKKLLQFLKVTGVLLVAAIFALLTNITSLWLVYDYSKDSTRGKSELTLDEKIKTSGLDKDYATGWSYGKLESFNLLIPDFVGGASVGSLSENSNAYKFLEENNVPNPKRIIKNLPLYWGPQPSTAGPVYMGAIMVFLFILGMFIVKDNIRWWLFTATVLALVLSWGKYFPALTNFFLDYFPGYNKFRTVSMILVIAEFAIPLLGILAVKKIVDKEISKPEFFKAIKYTSAIIGSIILFFLLFSGGLFDFIARADKHYLDGGWPQQFIDAIREDRKWLLKADAIRSLIFIALAVSLIWLFYMKKINSTLFYIALSLFILIDFWTINKRYLNDEYFVSAHEDKNPFEPTEADKMILLDKDPDYRVLNLAADPFNDATTSYFHKSIGGYHGAKMKRYQELIENHMWKNNMSVLNMLNTKYIITSDKEKGEKVQRNPSALGNAWFVKKYTIVENADAEIKALTDFKPDKEAIVDKRFLNQLKDFTINYDSTATIKLSSYEPNDLVYISKSSSEQLAVFSEIYYSKGWNAFIDEKPAEHFRANYVLRAMKVPAGEHKIEYKFEPQAYYTGEKISLASSLILIIGFFFIVIKDFVVAKK